MVFDSSDDTSVHESTCVVKWAEEDSSQNTYMDTSDLHRGIPQSVSKVRQALLSYESYAGTIVYARSAVLVSGEDRNPKGH